jgi:hypothetical protein
LLEIAPIHFIATLQGGFYIRLKKHPPIRASNEKYCFIPNRLSANPFHFTLTATTQKIEANTVLLGFNQLTQAGSQLGILGFRQVTLKHAVLHPLTIRLENFVDFGSTFVLRNVVADYKVHRSPLLQD